MKKNLISNLIFFQNGLGQKRYGIERTVSKLYRYYNNDIYFSQSNKIFVKNTNNLSKNLLNLYNVNYNLIKTDNNKIINIGGDHSMSIGSLGASLNIYGSDLKVVWIDAHADINTICTSLSGNVHGMPLAFLTGIDSSDEYYYLSKYLKFDNLCYIGIRDLDIAETKIIKKYKIKTILSNDFNFMTNNITNKLIKWCKNSPVHLSIDIDSLDPYYMQHTGTKANRGLKMNALLKFINMFCHTTNIVNIDLAELNLYNPECYNLSKDEKNRSFNNFNLILKNLF